MWKNLPVLGKLYGRTDLSSGYHRLRLPSLTHFHIGIPTKVSQWCKCAIYIKCHSCKSRTSTHAQPRANCHSVAKGDDRMFSFLGSWQNIVANH